MECPLGSRYQDYLVIISDLCLNGIYTAHSLRVRQFKQWGNPVRRTAAQKEELAGDENLELKCGTSQLCRDLGWASSKCVISTKVFLKIII